MAVNSVTAPFFAFADTAGKPLEAGYIYIGQPGLEAQSSPKASFFDVAMTIPTGTSTGAAVRTSGGYPVRNGSAAQIYVDGDYSTTVKDRNGVLIFSRLNRAIQVGNETTASGLFADGNLAGAGIGFGAEPTTGLIRSAANQMRGIVGGTPIWQANASGFSLFSPLPITSGGLGATSAAGGLGNLGLTATAAELNILDGATVTTAEINALDGVTAAGTAMIVAADVAAQRTLLGFAQSLTASGYVQLPGGVIIQWVTTGAAGSGSNGVVNFPIAFPSACTAVALQYVNTGSDEAVGANWVAQVRAISASSFTIRNLGPASGIFYAIAVGY